MNISNAYNARMTSSCIKHFDSNPFNVIDVGCSGGVDSGWEILERNCNIFAFDPQQSEIERLSKRRSANNLLYECYWVMRTAAVQTDKEANKSPYFDPQEPWRRSSASSGSAAMHDKYQQSNPINENLTDKKISVDDYALMRDLKTVDFIKIDCDGGDLDAIRSAWNVIQERKVKALLVEVNWSGGTDENSNTYHNIDRLLKTAGFQPFAIEQNTFSKAALPLPYKYSIFAQTNGGQPVQGDVLFVRDCGAKDFEAVTGQNWDPVDYLKAACLFELFGLQDCAAEILVNKREKLQKILDVDVCLDMLVKEVYPEEQSYRNFMTKFNANPSLLFPGITQKQVLNGLKRLIHGLKLFRR